ncbi:MAG: 3'-5' exonuclease [Desulfobacterales bacterium]|nr:3'-5' exonuclease [Desulfobacterales bacterium]
MKKFWFDTETTGTNPRRHSIIQLAGLVEIEGTVVEEVEILMRPLDGRNIEQEALDINGYTMEQIMAFPPAVDGLLKLQKVLARYVNKYKKSDKFVASGYNVGFDMDMLYETWFAVSDQYGPGSWIFSAREDILTDVARLIALKGLRLDDYKLGTVCDAFGVKLGLDAHNAVADIRATRELGRIVCEELYGWKQAA